MDEGRAVRLTVTCIGQPECNVYFEPEGAEFQITSMDRLTAEVSGEIEISAIPDGVIIGAEAGTTRVWDSAGNQVEGRPQGS